MRVNLRVRAAMALVISALTLGASWAPATAAGSDSPPVAANRQSVTSPTTGWLQARGDAAHTGANLTEQTLTPQTVTGLAPAWSVPISRPEWVVQSNAAVTSGVAYQGTWDGHLLAVDTATGNVIWQRMMRDGRLGGVMGTTPVDANSVFTWQADGTVRAYRRYDGHMRWSVSQPNGGGIPSSPLVLAGGTLYGALDHTIWARNARTGALLWEKQIEYTAAAPSVWRDRLVVVTGYGNVLGISRATGETLWTTPVSRVSSEPASVSPTGQVFVGTMNCSVASLDARTGAMRWNKQLYTPCTSLSAYHTAVHDGTVFTTTTADDVFALSAATGATRWQKHLADSAWAAGYASQPVIAGGVVYLAGGKYLWAMRESDGEMLTTLPTQGTFGEPVVWDGIVYTTGQDHALHAYRVPSAPSAS